MRIFIPTYGRASTISTPKLLNGLDWQIVVHDDFEARAYRKLNNYPIERVLVSGVDLGIARQRNWILDHCVETGEWFVFMDDNIKEFQRVQEDLYGNETLPVDSFTGAFWKKQFEVPCDPTMTMALLKESRDKAVSIGAKIVGLATTENHFFRRKKWREKGFACTKTAIVQKTHLRFDENFFAKDDVDFSAQNINAFGKVLVNNFLYPKALHHQLGGVGNKMARLNYTRKEALMLVDKWPNIVGPGKVREGAMEEVRFK